jgi:hypothetical protein
LRHRHSEIRSGAVICYSKRFAQNRSVSIASSIKETAACNIDFT